MKFNTETPKGVLTIKQNNMYWEITVSTGTKHVFTTSKGSCLTVEKTAAVLKEIRDRFTAEEGFKTTVAYVPESSFASSSVQDKGYEALKYLVSHLGDA